MKKLSATLLLFIAAVLPAKASDLDSVALTAGRVPTYVYSTPYFTPVAATTTMVEIAGVASRKLKIQRILASYSATAIGQAKFYVNKRSTVCTGGTPVTTTPVGFNSLQTQTSSAVCRHFTANPTVGTLVGQVRAVAVTSEGVNATPQSDNGYKTIYEHNPENGPLQLNTAAETITIDAGGVIPGGTAPTVSFSIEYTEEP